MELYETKNFKAVLEYEERVRELNRFERAHGLVMLRGAYAEIFKTYPALLAVRWEQYTPTQSDGDPVSFSVYDVRYRIVGLAALDAAYRAELDGKDPEAVLAEGGAGGEAEDADDDDEDDDDEDDDGFVENLYPSNPVLKQCVDAFDALHEPMKDAVERIRGNFLEPLYEAAFGESSRVTITRANEPDGIHIEIEHYEDY